MINFSKIFKTILFLSAIIALTACSDKARVYEDEYVSFPIPEGAQTGEVQSGLLKGQNYFKEGEFSYSVYEVPAGIATLGSQTFLRLMGLRWIEDDEFTEDEIDGYPVKVYTDVMSGNYDIYIQTYLFSNGEKSVILVESQKDKPGSYWKENLKWKLPKQSNLPLENRTRQLADFFNQMFNPLMGGNLQINPKNDTLDVQVVMNISPSFTIPENEATPQQHWQILNCFDVIREYAAQNCNFTITLADTSGNEIVKIDLPVEDEVSLTCEEEL